MLRLVGQNKDKAIVLIFESQEVCQTFRLIYELGNDYSTKTSMSQGDDRLAFILNKLLFEQVPVLFD